MISWSLPMSHKLWSKHKLCPTHGLSNLLISDVKHPSQTGLCAHHDCINKQLSALQAKKQCGYLIKFCRQLDKDEEFTSFIIEQLLKGAYPKVHWKNPDQIERVTVLNPTCTRWFCLKFLNHLKKEEVYQERIIEFKDEIDRLMMDIASHTADSFSLQAKSGTGNMGSQNPLDPEQVYRAKEMIETINEMFGPEYYLYLTKEITRTEFRKVTGLSVFEANKVQAKIQKYYHRYNRIPKDALESYKAGDNLLREARVYEKTLINNNTDSNCLNKLGNRIPKELE